jgi:hypothetical protein
MALISAKSVVLEIKDNLRAPEGDYWRIWNMLVNVYRDVNLYHTQEARLSKQTMDNNYIIYYPDDMVDLVSVYVPYEGKMVRLTPSNIVPTTSLQMGETVLNVEDGEGEAIRTSVSGYKAKPFNPFGYYYNYKKGRYIKFLVESRTEVILAYKTTGLTTDDTFIPVEYKNALIWGVIYQETLLGRNSMWRTQDVEKMYNNALMLIKRPKFDVEAFLDVWLNGATLNR